MSKLYDQLRNAVRARAGETEGETPALLAQALKRAQAERERAQGLETAHDDSAELQHENAEKARAQQEAAEQQARQEAAKARAQRAAAEQQARARVEEARAQQQAAEAAAREEQARAEHAERLAQWAQEALAAENARIAAEEKLRDRAKIRAEAAEKRRVSLEARDAATRRADQVAGERAAMEESAILAPSRTLAKVTLVIGLLGATLIGAVAVLHKSLPAPTSAPAPIAAVAKSYPAELKLETALDASRLTPRTDDAARSSPPDPGPSR